MNRRYLRTAGIAAATLASSMVVPVASAHPAGVNANAQADLRNLATLEEEYFTDYAHYGTFSQMHQGEPNQMSLHRGVTVTIVHLEVKRGYCLRATTSTKTYVYDSLAGGMVSGTHCKAVTNGPSGGTRKGPYEV